nr:MAG TPA: hypothetical protein [Caudoviricetes sp.]
MILLTVIFKASATLMSLSTLGEDTLHLLMMPCDSPAFLSTSAVVRFRLAAKRDIAA